jgi:geranylgeranyl reductase family protein
MSRYDADVLVVGTGPAGATAARWLAEKGVAVLLLERQRLPRYKPCGGALTRRTLKLLTPLDVTPVVEAVVHALTVEAPDGDRFTITLPEPLIATVMRDRFDAFLTEAATAAGARLREGESVTRCEVSEEGVTVTTNRRTYRARFLVGADGANSVVAHQLGLRPHHRALSLVAELTPDAKTNWDGSIHLLFPSQLNGYAWCFPKGAHLSAGIYSLRPMLPDWQRWLTGYLSRLRLSDCFQRHRLQGHPVPLADKFAQFHRKTALIVGDAAGLADPFTGEGISWAIESAQMAASVLWECLNGDLDSLQPYTDAVRHRLLPELRAAVWFARLLFAFPQVCCRWFLRHEAVLRNFAQLLSGEVTYRTLWRKVWRKGFILLRRPKG